jgi:hypothetical protein
MVLKQKTIMLHQEVVLPDHTEEISLELKAKAQEATLQDQEYTALTDQQILKAQPGRQALLPEWEVKMEGVRQ